MNSQDVKNADRECSVTAEYRPPPLFGGRGYRAVLILIGSLLIAGFLLQKSQTARGAEGAPAYEKRWEAREFKPVASTCYTCHETQDRKLGKPAHQHITSAHYRAAVTCHECHGGDHTLDDIDKAHDKAKGFIGKLDAKGMTDRCGKCHAHEVQTFVASKHFPEHEGVRQVTCIECHGSHDIGAGTRPPEFAWQNTCANCHGLDNVKKLPADLVAMMTNKTEVYEKMRALRLKLNNAPYPPEVMEPYREVRQMSADIVHATKHKGIGKELTEIVAKSKALEDKIVKATGQ